LLPMNDKRYSLVWCLDPQSAEQVLGLNDDEFIESLQSAFGYRAGVFNRVSARASYPLALTVAQSLVSHRTALVGNSSHTIHPIAGQGFNLGMRDIEAMRQTLVTGLAAGDKSSLGGFSHLADYQHRRQQDLEQVITMTDSLVKLFSNESRLMALGRSTGLVTLQVFDWFKTPLINQAMGFNSKNIGNS